MTLCKICNEIGRIKMGLENNRFKATKRNKHPKLSISGGIMIIRKGVKRTLMITTQERRTLDDLKEAYFQVWTINVYY